VVRQIGDRSFVLILIKARVRHDEYHCGMQRSVLEENLAQCERHIALSTEVMARQRELIAERERDGHDATESHNLLRLFEELHALHLTHRDRLQKELAEQAPAGTSAWQ